MSRTIQTHESFLQAIAEEIDITEGQYEEAVKKYTSVGNWLDREDSTIAKYNPEIFPQGSFLIGTTIRPLGNGEEFDIDLVCKLDASKTEVSQEALKGAVGVEIQSYSKAFSMVNKPVNGRRCWTLDYAESTRFHMDILPAIPDEESYRLLLERSGFIEEAYNPRLTLGALSITDREHDEYRKISDEWPSSNPLGYAAWFKDRMSGQLLERKRQLVEEKKLVVASVQDVPDHQVKTSLQRSIQLLKRHRDNYFRDNPEHKPISIIISTLAARCYENEPGIVESLSAILKDMDSYIEDRNGVKWVVNPVNPAENFADKWHEVPEKKDVFYKWLEAARRDFGIYLREMPYCEFPRPLEEAFSPSIEKISVGIPTAPMVVTSKEQVDHAISEIKARRSETLPWALR